MYRSICLVTVLLVLSGCKTPEPEVSARRSDNRRRVDVDVSRRHVDVQVRPEDGEDVSVNIGW